MDLQFSALVMDLLYKLLEKLFEDLMWEEEELFVGQTVEDEEDWRKMKPFSQKQPTHLSSDRMQVISPVKECGSCVEYLEETP